MRIKKEYPKEGDIKVIRKFLWMPLEIDGETRWLEYANIKCKWIVRGDMMDFWWEWSPIEFVDEAPSNENS